MLALTSQPIVARILRRVVSAPWKWVSNDCVHVHIIVFTSISNHNITAPVSCGQPGGKQCSYNTQCNANAAGYNEQQCCPSVPDGVACNAISAPVECGDIPCVYSNQVRV